MKRSALFNIAFVLLLGLIVALLTCIPSAYAQSVVTIIPVGTDPRAVAVNPITKNIYVANQAIVLFRR